MRPQSFLPVWSPGHGFTHIVAIPMSDFDPMPSTVWISGHQYNTALLPMRQVNHRGKNGAFQIAVIAFTDYEVRTRQNSVIGAVPIGQVVNFGDNFVVRGAHYQVRAILDWLTNMFFYGAPVYGPGGGGGPFPPPPLLPPPPLVPFVNNNWTVTTPFATSPNCQFYDLNWVTELKNTNPSLTPVSISISVPSDATVAANLKVFIVQSVGFGSVMVGGTEPVADTLRFVKISALPLPAGTHTYSAVVTAKASDGSAVSLNININLIL